MHPYRLFMALTGVLVASAGCTPPLPVGQWSRDGRQFAAYDVQNQVAYRLTRPNSDADGHDWSAEILHDMERPDPAFVKAHELMRSEEIAKGFGVDGDLRQYAIAWYDVAGDQTTLNVVAAPFGTSPLPEPSRQEVAPAPARFQTGFGGLQVEWSPAGTHVAVSTPAILIDGGDLPSPVSHVYEVETRQFRAFPGTTIPKFRSGTTPLVGGEAFCVLGCDAAPSRPSAFRPDGKGFLAVRRDPASKRFEAVFVGMNGDFRRLEFAGVEGDDVPSRRLAESLPENPLVDALALHLSADQLATDAGANALLAASMLPPVATIRWEGSVATVVRRSLMPEQGADYALRIDSESGNAVAFVAPPRPERRYLEGNTYNATWEYVFPGTGVMLVSVKHQGAYERLLVVRPDGTTERLGDFDRWTASVVYPSPDGKAAVVFAGRQAQGGGLLQPAPNRYAAMLGLTVLEDGSFRPMGGKVEGD